jgi:hypothetical protein
MNDCSNILLCKLGLNTRAEVKKWLVANHPDHGGKSDLDSVEVYQQIKQCFTEKKEIINKEAEMRWAEAERRWAREPAKNSADESKERWSSSEKDQRAKVYKCMRQTENWSKILPAHKLDNTKFNPEAVTAAIHDSSPKLEQLFRIIEQVDANDMATHGKLFKHFIFSDVKEEGYGAKILASAFIAKGFKSLITLRRELNQMAVNQQAPKLVLLEAGPEGKDKSFGILSSTALFNLEFNQKFKRKVLQTYNKRPDNIQGADMRFIILDSGFKEGIDLFDVKYVHIFELSMTIADLKQTIGRATRTCGQKGLNFEPNVGWPLYVYNYYVAVPAVIQAAYKATKPELLEKDEENIFRQGDKFKDATMLYSTFDKTLNVLAEQLYKLAPVLSTDFPLTENIHRTDDITYLYDITEQNASASRTGGGGGARKVKDTINCKGKCGVRTTNDIPASVDFLRKVYKKYGHNLAALPEKNTRAYLCDYMSQSPDYCSQVNKDWAERAAMVPDLMDKAAKKASKAEIADEKARAKVARATAKVARATAKAARAMARATLKANRAMARAAAKGNQAMARATAKGTRATAKRAKATARATAQAKSSPKIRKITIRKNKKPSKNISPYKLQIAPFTKKRLGTGTGTATTSVNRRRSSSVPKSTSPLKIANEVMQQLDLVPYVKPMDDRDYAIVEYTGKEDPKLKMKQPGPPKTKLNFTKMRDFIKTNFAENFTWGEIVIENKCGEPPKPVGASMGGASMGGASRIMKLNPSQDFVRTFFTPASPYKGFLLWQSVGTGKTCTAIATATSTFEREGYTILWVTRNTLRSDVYKNMFDDVCHLVLAEKMQKEGLTIPDDQTKRRKLLSQNWIEPISYKTFSNLLTARQHNVYMDKLIARNGSKDILRKTLIIIDEAHKLYGGDLKRTEQPDMNFMEGLLQKSYALSGKDSARLLIMTATPFTNSPMELFKLINLCKEKSEHITVDPEKFKSTYMGADNLLTQTGIKKLSDELSGYFSYLNREQDPTQFAQPIMIEVPAIMTHLNDTEVRAALFELKDEKNKQKPNSKIFTKIKNARIKELKAELKATKKNMQEMYKTQAAKCKTLKNPAEKAQCNKEAKEQMEAAQEEAMAEINAELEQVKAELSGENTQKARAKELKAKIKNLKESLLQEVQLVNRCKSVRL